VLQEAVEAAVAAGSYTAQEPTVDCAEHLSHRTGGHGTAAGAEGAEGGIGDSSRSERECSFDALQVVIWFHHIKSTEKRKNLVAWARELDCSGFSKPGFPGVVVVEGLVSDVREYVGRVRALQWQAMQVRAEHTVCCAACSNGGGQQLLPSPRADSQLQEQQQLGQGLQQQQQQQHKRGSLQQQQQQQPAARAFTGKFTELPESGMSQLSLECKAAGMEDLFLAALKLTK
jgi:iron only hydrogenase large subunit-like protein